MKNNKVVYGWFNDKECFYIGMGSQRRSKSAHGRNPYCNRKRELAKKDRTFRVEIFDKKLTVDQACKLEIELIKELGRRDLGTGCLTNMTDGGEGCNYWKGRTMSPFTKKKISESLKGKEKSKETKRKMSEARKGVIYTEKTKQKMREKKIGTKHSEQSKSKRSEMSRGKNNPFYGKQHPSRKRVQINDIKYESLSTASTITNMCLTTISRRCKNENFPNYRFLP